MFSKKLMNILCWILAVMLVIQLVLLLIVWVWSLFGTVSIPQQLNEVIGNLMGIGQVVFFYVVVGTMRNLLLGGKK